MVKEKKDEVLIIFEGNVMGDKNKINKFKELLKKLVKVNKGEVKINA